MTQCDPFAVVTRLATEPGRKPCVLGKTEIVPNTQSPTWVQRFTFDYELGTPCQLAVSVFHRQSNGEPASLGAALLDVGKTLAARGSTKAKKVQGGTLLATMRQSQSLGIFSLQLAGKELRNVEGLGIFRKSDPLYEIYRDVSNAGANTWELVYRSEVIKDNLNPP